MNVVLIFYYQHDLVTLFTCNRNFWDFLCTEARAHCYHLICRRHSRLKMAWSGSQYQQLSASADVMHRKNRSIAQCPSNNFGMSYNSGKSIHDHSRTNQQQRSNGNAIRIQDVNQASSNVVRRLVFLIPFSMHEDCPFVYLVTYIIISVFLILIFKA